MTANARGGNAPSPIRVALIDDQAVIREALAELLEAVDSFEVVGSAGSAEEGLELVAAERPDVVIVEPGIEGGVGEATARRLLESAPSTKVCAVSATTDRDSVLGMFRAGALGFVDKASSPEQLLEAIRSVAAGRPVVSPEISGEIVAEVAGRFASEQGAELDAAAKRERIERMLGEPDAMRMVFQPIFEIATGRLVGFEALARFQSEPPRPPNEWFADAADVGLGTALEAEAIRRALEYLPELPAWAYLSVNVSPESVPTFGLEAVLEEAALDRMVIEITEHAIVEDYSPLDRTLEAFRERGLRVAVDDAGAGYASLRHIVRLSPDIIKLDGDLTSGIERDAARRALATALITFATETDEEIVAEGVETVDELHALQALGVPFAQGYLLGRPASWSEHSRTRLPDHFVTADGEVPRPALDPAASGEKPVVVPGLVPAAEG